VSFEEDTETAAAPASAPPRKGRSLMPWIIVGVGGAFFFFLLLVGGAAAYFLWPSGGATAQNWKDFPSSAGCFSVALPGAPAHQQKTDPQFGDDAAEVHEFTAGDEAHGTYAVHYVDLPGVPDSNYLFFLGMKNQMIEAFPSGKLTAEKAITYKTHEGKEYVLELPEGKLAVQRTYLVDARAFWLTAVRANTPASATAAEKFFDSVEVTSTPPRKATQVAVAPAPETPAPATPAP